MGKDYLNLNINSEINKKINSIDTVRNARIQASKRLENLSKIWNILFFFLNVMAVLFVLSSIIIIQNKSFTLITSFYTLYVILIQYFILIQNYQERSLRFHYHQLQLEDTITELKILLLKKAPDNKKIYQYNKIMERYSLKLPNIENHTDLDYSKNTPHSKKRRSNFNLDDFILIINILIFILIIIYYILFLF